MPDNKDAEVLKLIADVKDLPTTPQLLPRLLEVLRRENSTLEEIGDLISFDPALTARVLKYCNAPTFAGDQPVDNVPDAVGRLGLEVVFQLVNAACGSAAFNLPAASGLDAGELWKHSLLTAYGAKFVGDATGNDGNMLFTAGLLHDIGRVVLAKAKGAEYGVLLVRAQVHKERAAECERASYGFTHADVSAVLMTIWKCPQPLVESVRYHHQPEAAGDAKMIAACVCVGNFLAHMNGDPLTSDGKPDANLIYSKALLGLTNEQIASFSDLMGENWDFVKALLRA